jgi:hypothetical protein
MNIETRQDQIRGCGWRKEGGLYLMGDTHGVACGKLPLPIGICPTCGHGVKVSRGFTWVNPVELFGDVVCAKNDGVMKEVINEHLCPNCPLSTHGVHQMHNAGMIWVGEKFYPSPDAFNLEAMNQGVSRRINSIPHQFELGKTWVFLAHRKGAVQGEPEHEDFIPTIFHAFLPKAIEYVVHPDDDEDKLERLIKKGVTLVRIERLNEQGEIIFKTEAHRNFNSFMKWMKGMTF